MKGYQILIAAVVSSNPVLRLIITLRISWQEMVSNLSILPCNPEKKQQKCARGAPKNGGRYQFASLQKDEREKRKERGGEGGILEGISDFKRYRGELESRSTAYQTLRISWQEMVSNLSIPPRNPEKKTRKVRARRSLKWQTLSVCVVVK